MEGRAAGGGYDLSSFCEQTALEHADAVIAVSDGVRDDVLRCYPAVDPARVHVVHNGIDHDEWLPTRAPTRLRRHGVDPNAPTVIFVGRVTRQKGIQYLLERPPSLDPSVQIVLRAGSPDTPELGHELARQVDALRARRQRRVDRGDAGALGGHPALTHADVFCCPSIYEPLGLVNLEAMACETSVVA